MELKQHGRVTDITQEDILLVTFLTEGYVAREMAEKLGIGRRAVEARVDKLKARTGANTLAELVTIFFRHKLIE